MKKTGFKFSKRAILFLVLIVGLAGYFWTQSRYPALDRKSLMGTFATTTGLSFDNVWPAGPKPSLNQRLISNTINWYYTNWRGMTFGLLFAALVLSFLKSVRWPQPKTSFGAAVFGAFLGAPMGVCANCVTPISKGLDAGGMRLETTLAVMFSSPTLNLVALSMAFSMLPFELALLKVGATAILILIFVPLISSKSKMRFLEHQAKAEPLPSLPIESWLQALVNSLKVLSRSLFLILKWTLPLMFLAGFLGSVFVEIFPLDKLPNLQFTPVGLLLVTFFGTLLPVPMTFDVIFVSGLLERGLNTGYAAALLFALGTFSIYPFLIVWKTIWPRLAVTLLVVVTLLGFSIGVVAKVSEDRFSKNLVSVLQSKQSPFIAEEAQAIIGSACDKRPESDQIECASRIAFDAISNAYNLTICDAMADKAGCVGMVYRFKWFMQGRPCAEVSPAQQAQCMGLTLWWLADAKWKQTPSFCARYKFPTGVCEDAKAYVDAVSAAAPENCANVRDAQRRQRCYWRAASLKAQSTRNPGACLEVPAEAREICLWDLETGIAAREKFNQYYREHQPQVDYLIAADTLKSSSETGAVFQTVSLKTLSILSLPFKTLQKNSEIEIQAAELKKSEAAGKELFKRVEGEAFGLVVPPMPVSDYSQPTYRGRGIASGDFNRDGWMDVVIGTSGGPVLFVNQGNWKFSPVTVGASFEELDLAKLDTIAVALVDLNGDGFLDLFMSSYSSGSYILWNKAGSFENTTATAVDQSGAITRSPAFYDLNQDSLLDVYLGNWFLIEASSTSPLAENFLLWNRAGKFEKDRHYKDQLRGTSHTVLLSDLNGDFKSEIIVGNDLMTPDEVIFDFVPGNFRRIRPAERIIPALAMNSMSLDSADVNNDLALDVFSVDIDWRHGEKLPYCSLMSGGEARAQCETVEKQVLALRSTPEECLRVGSRAQVDDCLSAMVRNLAIRRRDLSLCNLIPRHLKSIAQQCRNVIQVPSAVYAVTNDDIPQVARNVMLIQDSGKWLDKTTEMKVSKSFFPWNARIHDYNSDGWQDIFVATGDVTSKEVSPNVLFLNQEGKEFKVAGNSGAEDRLNMTSYTVADFDNDGDLDVIAPAFNGPVVIFQNATTANSLQVEIQDSRLNFSGIGSKIYIETASGWQMREVKASGGFNSFDSTIAHFGLGSQTQVKSIKVRWSNGSESVFSGPFATGQRLRLRRGPAI